MGGPAIALLFHGTVISISLEIASTLVHTLSYQQIRLANCKRTFCTIWETLFMIVLLLSLGGTRPEVRPRLALVRAVAVVDRSGDAPDRYKPGDAAL